MGSGHVVGMEPDVAAVRHAEGDLVILRIVLAYIDVVAVTADVMERKTLRCSGTSFFSVVPLIFAAGVFAAQEAALLHFTADLGQITVSGGEFQGVLDAPEVIDLCLDFRCQAGEGFIGPLHAGVAVKEFLRVLLRCQCGIQRDFDHLAGVIVQDFAALCAFGDRVSVGIEKLSVYFEFVPFFRVFDLAALQVIFVNIALQNGLDNVAEVGGALTDAGVEIFARIKILQQSRRRIVSHFAAVSVVVQGNKGKLRGGAGIAAVSLPAVHDRGELLCFDLFYKLVEFLPERFFFGRREKGGAAVLGEPGAVGDLLGDNGRKTGVAFQKEL